MLSNKGLDLRFVDITYKVNNWTDTFKIGNFLYNKQKLTL